MLEVFANELEKYRKSYLIKWIIALVLFLIPIGLLFYFIFKEDKIDFINIMKDKTNFLKIIRISLALYIFFIIFDRIISYKIKKAFSHFAKAKLFNILKNIDTIEIVDYTPKSNDLKNVANKIYSPFDTYEQEDNITLKYKNINVRIAEVRITKRVWSWKGEEKVFSGLVYTIPYSYAKKTIIHNHIKENKKIHIFVSQESDKFEFSLFKPISSQDIMKVFDEIKESIQEISKYIEIVNA